MAGRADGRQRASGSKMVSRLVAAGALFGMRPHIALSVAVPLSSPPPPRGLPVRAAVEAVGFAAPRGGYCVWARRIGVHLTLVPNRRQVTFTGRTVATYTIISTSNRCC